MKETLISLAKDLVSIPSLSNDIDQLHLVIERCRREFNGFSSAVIHTGEVNQKPHLLVGNFDFLNGEKRADVILNGHVDVVPPSEDDQFSHYIEDGRLYGRGTIDMKAAVAVMIETMKTVLQKGTKKKVLLMITSDEEVSGENGVQALVAQGYVGDIVIIPDAGDPEHVMYAEKGFYEFSAIFTGKEGHSSVPWHATNALDLCFSCVCELKENIIEIEKQTEPEYRTSSVALTMLSGGHAGNVIPGTAEGTVSIRHTEKFSKQEIIDLVGKIVSKHGGVIGESHYGNLVFTDKDHQVLRSYKKHAEGVYGHNINFGKMHGATDGRFFGEEDCVLIFHGLKGKNLHGKNEYVEIEGMEPLWNLLTTFILDANKE